jgi:UDP-glucose 4-epimerase
MKIIVTGSNGFIGNKIGEYFKNLGHEVYGVDRSESQSSFKTFNVSLLSDESLTIFRDIKPDLFIHCAGSANVGLSVQKPLLDFESNVQLLYNTLLNISILDKIPRFLFLSSAAVYGNPEKLPIRENDNLNPISPYGLHKKICEEICTYFKKVKNVDVRIARIFSAYGDGAKKQLLWDLANKAKLTDEVKLFGTGNESRDFIHIDDLISALATILLSDSEEYIFNVANGEEITIKYIAELFKRAYKDKDFEFTNDIKEGDPINWVADISRLRSIGYSKKIDISEGVNRYIKWVNCCE